MASSCAYCELPEVNARMVSENAFAWAFPTNIPIVEGHTIVAPKRCTPTLRELGADERQAVLDLADHVMGALRVVYGAEGFNCAWNEGRLAGQSVPHFHLHILPRKEGDTGLLGYDPRSMLYRTGDREPTAEADLLKIRDVIRGGLSQAT